MIIVILYLENLGNKAYRQDRKKFIRRIKLKKLSKIKD